MKFGEIADVLLLLQRNHCNENNLNNCKDKLANDGACVNSSVANGQSLGGWVRPHTFIKVGNVEKFVICLSFAPAHLTPVAKLGQALGRETSWGDARH